MLALALQSDDLSAHEVGTTQQYQRTVWAYRVGDAVFEVRGVHDLRRIGRAIAHDQLSDAAGVVCEDERLDLLGTGQRFDVIFSDLMMPEMSGMDFYQELTRSFPEVVSQVVFISGGAFTPSAHAFIDAVPNRRIEKPFDPEIVRDVVRQVLNA